MFSSAPLQNLQTVHRRRSLSSCKPSLWPCHKSSPPCMCSLLLPSCALSVALSGWPQVFKLISCPSPLQTRRDSELIHNPSVTPSAHLTNVLLFSYMSRITATYFPATPMVLLFIHYFQKLFFSPSKHTIFSHKYISVSILNHPNLLQIFFSLISQSNQWLQVLFSFLWFQLPIQLTIGHFLSFCQLSLCCTPSLPVLVSTFFNHYVLDLPQGLLPVGYTQNTSSRRHPKQLPPFNVELLPNDWVPHSTTYAACMFLLSQFLPTVQPVNGQLWFQAPLSKSVGVEYIYNP